MDVDRFWFNGRIKMFDKVKEAIESLPKNAIEVCGRQTRSELREGLDFVVEVKNGLHIYAMHPRKIKAINHLGIVERREEKCGYSFECGDWKYYVHLKSRRVK